MSQRLRGFGSTVNATKDNGIESTNGMNTTVAKLVSSELSSTTLNVVSNANAVPNIGDIQTSTRRFGAGTAVCGTTGSANPYGCSTERTSLRLRLRRLACLSFTLHR